MCVRVNFKKEGGVLLGFSVYIECIGGVIHITM